MKYKNFTRTLILFVSLVLFSGCCCADSRLEATAENRSFYQAPFAPKPPSINGVADDAVWAKAEWKPIKYVLIGENLTANDFSGRIKAAWDGHYLYVLAEIVDDVISDVYANPLEHWWDDDTLEIFIDEDLSGGDHQYNHNAFAYHVALDGQVVDTGIDKKPHLYNDNIKSKWLRHANALVWELKIKVYGDDFIDGEKNRAQPVVLSSGKKIGFMAAYCDNDGKPTREHFIGTEDIVPVNGDRNRGWITADVFGIIELIQ